MKVQFGPSLFGPPGPQVMSIVMGVPAKVPENELTWKHPAEQKTDYHPHRIHDAMVSETGTPSLAA